MKRPKLDLKKKLTERMTKKLSKDILEQIANMTAKDMHTLFLEKLLPFFTVANHIEFQLLPVNMKGKTYYAILWRDKDDL